MQKSALVKDEPASHWPLMRYPLINHLSVGINKTLDQFTYADKYINDLIVESFYEIEFVGLQGPIMFGSGDNLFGLIGFRQQIGKQHHETFAVEGIFEKNSFS